MCIFLDNSDCASQESFDNFESRSMRSTATTIPPDEIKKRLAKQMASKKQKQSRKKCVAKGEASAVTRRRRENTNTIKHGNDFWDD